MNKKFIFTNENGEPYPEWEQKKLGDFLSKYTDTTIHVEDEKSYSQLTVSKNTGVSKRGDILGAQIGRKRQFVVDTNKYPNTLTFTRQTVMDGGIGFISPELNGFIATENMPLLSLDISKCKKEYLNQYIGSDSYYEKVIFPIKPTGSAQIALHEKDWLAQVVPLPSLAEQQKIAEFFSALDERIALTANKVKLLKEQKAGYLQRVFAQELVFTDDNGDRYPEWEQKKLGEVAKIKMGFTPSTENKNFWTGDIPWLSITGFGSKYIDEGTKFISTEALGKKSVLPSGSLVMSFKLTLGKLGIIKKPMVTNEAICSFEWNDEATTTNEFAFYALSSLKFEKFANRAAAGLTLNDKTLKLLPIQLPSLPEQEKIAEFFSALDEQIELTENKLSLLKEQKKGYLQGIFG